MTKPTIKHSVSIGLIVTACILAYLPGLTDFMLADDQLNIVENSAIKISQLDFDSLKSAVLGYSGDALSRPLASLSFSLNYYFSGQKIVPSHFKASNLAIHIANSVLIYTLTLALLSVCNKRTKRLTEKNTLTLALLITLLWALHPIQLTAILYSVQRMTSMASFFMLAGLILYLQGRKRLEEGRPHALTIMFGGIVLGATLGTLCKEIALLLPFYAGAIELTLYYNENRSGITQRKLRLFYLTTAATPAVIGMFYLASHPQFVFSGYLFRDFTLIERLLTEARVLFYYIELIIYPSLSQLSLHHDDILISHSLFAPPTTMFALLGLAFILPTALILRKKYAVFSFMVVWYLVGQAMESTFFGLEIAYEHRNYLPSYSIIFGVIFFSFLFLQKIIKNNSLKITIAIAVCASMFFTTYARASIWSKPEVIAYFDQRNHPNSIRSQMTYAEHLLKAGAPLPQAYEHIRKAASITITEISPIIHLYKVLRIIGQYIDVSSKDYVEKETPPDGYDAPLILNKKYINELIELIDIEITRRLHGKISTHRAAIALSDLGYCILSENSECTPLTANAIRWLTIMLDNPRHTDQTIAVIYYSLAKLKAYAGDLAAAFYYIDKAIIVQPGDFSIIIDKVKLYLTVEDKRSATELIQKLERRGDTPENYKQELQNIKQYINSGSTVKK